ncbi:MAG TPA: hypothetical protein VK459_16470 [Polyangiaceae bacterium]|jgi:hypothetical protein|nr:hypothetical protein [Polyangiaceae bacterium]
MLKDVKPPRNRFDYRFPQEPAPEATPPGAVTLEGGAVVQR